MFDEQDFCGRVCKTDGDCLSGQVCQGKASLFANGKLGADVATCTVPASAPAASVVSHPDAAAPLPFVPRGFPHMFRPQIRPGAGAPPDGRVGAARLCPRAGAAVWAGDGQAEHAVRLSGVRRVFPKWVGRCTTCSAWNTLVEEVTREESGRGRHGFGPGGAGRSAALPVGEVDVDHAARLPTGIGELDRVLGGGAVLGGVTLLGGDPGVGKSTLLLQALACLAAKGCRSLYVSGEESAAQTAARARRVAPRALGTRHEPPRPTSSSCSPRTISTPSSASSPK